MKWLKRTSRAMVLVYFSCFAIAWLALAASLVAQPAPDIAQGWLHSSRNAGNPVALLFALAAHAAAIVNVVDPDVIVLGGGLSNIARLYERVPQLWVPYVFSDRIATKLVRARFGDSSGVRGAAWL